MAGRAALPEALIGQDPDRRGLVSERHGNALEGAYPAPCADDCVEHVSLSNS